MSAPPCSEYILKKKNPWDDHYAARARDQKWLARSVFKLEEIDRKYRILVRGARILDLGCYPGSWSQYCLKKVGPQGDVVGIDLKRPERLSATNFRFLQEDILSLDPDRLKGDIGARDAVISDLAPKTTGIRLADESRSLELAAKALAIALALLRKNGHFLCKIFEGEDLKTFRNEASPFFSRMRTMRPTAIRKQSREVYLVGTGYRAAEM